MEEVSIQIKGVVTPEQSQILTSEAGEFIASLARQFNPRRLELLHQRELRQQELDAGRFPDFLPQTTSIRQLDWTVAPIPKDLLDRKVEITGPVDRKMIINALNSGASVFMADFEDSHTPTWANNLNGQLNLRDAVRREISFTSPEGKEYKLNEKTATLMVRPRGWHLPEKHFLVDGKPVSGSLFDFGLFFFHNAKEQVRRGTGPYFYLPKMESHLEARLWNDVFVFAQAALGIPRGTIRATVLIETILAAFEMDEILYELKDHSAGLNCGRWDYIFSVMKKFRNHPAFVFPDRSQVTMDRPFLKSYVDLLIKTCHRRGIHAMGGMAAQIPIKSDPVANELALGKVRADKEREVKAGHDGTWVAHPGLVPIALEIFERGIQGPNQLNVKRSEVKVIGKELLAVPPGAITEVGLRTNISVGVRYLESWLRGVGCVPLNNLMEDAATAEISRSQIWQWIRHKAKLNDGRTVTRELVATIMREEIEANNKSEEGARLTKLLDASQLFIKMMTAPEIPEFLTLAAYELID
jgi:malate synthase